MGQTRGKRALRDRIAEKMENKMHVSLEVAYTMFPSFEIIFQNDEMAYEISSFLELEDDEIKRFRKRKIPKKVIKKMEKEINEAKRLEREELNKNIKTGIYRESTKKTLNKVKENAEEKVKDSKSDDDSNVISNENPEKENFKPEEKESKPKKSKKPKKEKESEKLDKGQTSLFSF